MIGRVLSRLRADNVTPELVWIYLRKAVHLGLASRPDDHAVLAILGCQRSGTSVMSRVFFRDLDTNVFREKSTLTGGAEGLRYIPFDELNRRMALQRASLVVFKMLVESQRANEFLESVDGARIVWLFRNYRDIVSSNLKKFGAWNGINDIRPFVTGEADNWRNQGCSEETRSIIRRHFSESMNPNDAAALFWFARNQLFFEQALPEEPRSMLVEYEQFVADPGAWTKAIYRFCGRDYPGDHLVHEVKTESVSKGKDVQLSPEIEKLCDDMLRRLQQATAGHTA